MADGGESELTPEERKLLPSRRQPAPTANWGTFGISSRLEAARRNRGVTQEALADAIGVGESTIRRLETKRTERVQLPILVNCALVLDVPLSSIIDAEDCKWTGPGSVAPSWRDLDRVMVFGVPERPGA